MAKKQEASGAWLVTPGEKKKLGRADISKAVSLLQEYKQAKRSIEQRIIEDEQWWKLRHWEWMRKNSASQAVKDEFGGYQPTSAWLFNSITNKHADAMDNYPEPNVLPREQSDEQDSKALGEILPVILERNDYEGTYSDNWWYKLKHGVCCYGVFWNPELENGLGDIEVRQVDLLNVFWEPGVTNIQDGRNLFIVRLMDNDTIAEQWPQVGEKLDAKGDAITVSDYAYDDTVDNANKSLVVDWYYKLRAPGGRTILHLCKFVGNEILFASQNDPQYRDVGWYAHGLYPVDFDVLYPEQGTPVGFGVIAVAKDPQMYIDKLSGSILRAAAWQAANRYWVKKDCGIDAKQFLDLKQPLVEVEGSLEEEKLRPIAVNQISGNLLNILQMKVDELKETSSNRDVSQGSSGGVTAASAIAALQEAGNKGSRDMIAGSYRSYTRQINLCIELIRQFYDEEREFRILGNGMQMEFISYSNRNLRDQEMGISAMDGAAMYRRPVFDISVKPQRRSAYSKIQQNELAKELYQMGVFNPEMAQQVMPMVQMMEFDGKDQVLEQVSQGQTLLNVVTQLQGQMQMLLAQLTGQAMPMEGAQAPAPAGAPVSGGPSRTERIVQGARPDVYGGGEGTTI